MGKCEELWISIQSEMSENSDICYNNTCDGISYPGFIRRIIPSDDFGCILMGNIRVGFFICYSLESYYTTWIIFFGNCLNSMFFSVELFSIVVLSFHCTFSFTINNEMQIFLELIITRSLSLFLFFFPPPNSGIFFFWEVAIGWCNWRHRCCNSRSSIWCQCSNHLWGGPILIF